MDISGYSLFLMIPIFQEMIEVLQGMKDHLESIRYASSVLYSSCMTISQTTSRCTINRIRFGWPSLFRLTPIFPSGGRLRLT